MKSKDIFKSIYDYSPKLDPWATAMIAMFDVAGEMWTRSLPIPTDWQYSPGMGGPEIEDESIRDQIKQVSDYDLCRLGDFLHRVTEMLKRHGHSY